MRKWFYIIVPVVISLEIAKHDFRWCMRLYCPFDSILNFEVIPFVNIVRTYLLNKKNLLITAKPSPPLHIRSTSPSIMNSRCRKWFSELFHAKCHSACNKIKKRRLPDMVSVHGDAWICHRSNRASFVTNAFCDRCWSTRYHGDKAFLD